MSSGIDRFQAVLGAAGFIPGVGFAFDLVNAGIYAGRGKGAEAAISAISALPGLGDAVGAAYKIAKTGQIGTKFVGTGLKQTARGVVAAVAENGAEQWARIHYGQQESFEWEQMVGAAISGGALGHLSVGVGRLNEASSSFAKRTAYLAAGSGAAGALGDAAAQLGAMASGRQDGFQWGRSATAFAGGALGAALGQAAFDKTCFRAGTPLVCEFGHQKVEDLKIGDRLAARSEFDPEGPIEFKAIEEVFVRRGLILEVTVGGQTIGTTVEHPFYLHGRGWTPAGELAVGDLLAAGDGRWLPVESLYNTGNLETVYNFRVADHHTYFVGDQNWGFDVWVHNAYRVSNAIRDSAVTKAWAQEADLVRRTGRGTRSWTARQKQQLLNTGKVRGYIGHHINSVNDSPLFASLPDNIQFVTFAQHYKIHNDGRYRIPVYGDLQMRS